MPNRTPLPPWRRRWARFFARPGVEIGVAVLVIASVVLTLVEFGLDILWGQPWQQSRACRAMLLVSDGITLIFVLELGLRYCASRGTWRYFREYWIEILAVAPLYWFAPGTRVLRLLRLIRLLRLFGVVSRLSSHFPYLVRRSVVEYVFVCGLLVCTVLFGTGAMMLFEGPRGESAQLKSASPLLQSAQTDQTDQTDQTEAGNEDKGSSMQFRRWFWFNVYSLFAGEPIPSPPQTLGGKIVTVIVMFMGLTIFAMFTGTVSAFMIERMRREGRSMELEDLHDHIIICGWNSKADIIVREFQASNLKNTPVVVITQWEGEQPEVPADLSRHIRFLKDDFTRVTALEQAGVHRAQTCIILSDTSGGRTEQDADARTILAALTVEKLNSQVYTCAELLNRSYGSHLKMGNVNDFVISGEFGAFLLAQAAMNRGLMGVFAELLTYQHGNEFYRTKLPPEYLGLTFMDLFIRLKQEQNAILVAVYSSDGSIRLNPNQHVFEAGEEVVVIAEHEVQL